MAHYKTRPRRPKKKRAVKHLERVSAKTEGQIAKNLQARVAREEVESIGRSLRRSLRRSMKSLIGVPTLRDVGRAARHQEDVLLEQTAPLPPGCRVRVYVEHLDCCLSATVRRAHYEDKASHPGRVYVRWDNYPAGDDWVERHRIVLLDEG